MSEKKCQRIGVRTENDYTSHAETSFSRTLRLRTQTNIFRRNDLQSRFRFTWQLRYYNRNTYARVCVFGLTKNNVFNLIFKRGKMSVSCVCVCVCYSNESIRYNRQQWTKNILWIAQLSNSCYVLLLLRRRHDEANKPWRKKERKKETEK